MISAEYLTDAVKVFSFDVFDTVLTRKVLQPTGIFALMQSVLPYSTLILEDSFIQNFPIHRIQAENFARRQSSCEEVTLEEIYQILAASFSLSVETALKLQSLEIQTELDSVCKVPKMLAVIDSLRRRGKRIIFISDMYLSKQVIEAMLLQTEVFQLGDRLYLSSDVSANKESGNLFRFVLEQEGCFPYELLHTGNNGISDIASARSLGIRTVHFAAGNINLHEAALLFESEAQQSGINHVGQLFAGTAKLARLTLQGNSPRAETLQRIGANVAGPILTSFVLWVLDQARNLGLHRLYFLARDGQILLEIARELSRKHGGDMELRYLYGSRQSWHLPAVFEIGDRELDWIFDADPIITLSILSRRTKVGISHFRDALFGKTKKVFEDDVALGNEELAHLRKAVTEELQSEILNQAVLHRQTAQQYFRQEGLYDMVSHGIVDLGWQGRMQDSLWRILQDGGFNAQLNGFYFGLSRENRSNNPGNQKRAYFFHPNCSDIFWSTGTRFGNLLEIFTAADHGMTTSYIFDEKGCYRPKLKAVRNHAAETWGLRELRQGVRTFAELFPYELTFISEQMILAFRENIARLMTVFLLNPKRDDAGALGNFPFSSDQAETYFRTFAPPLSFMQALRYSIHFDSLRKLTYTYWPEGTRACSPPLTRFILSPIIQCLINWFNKVINRVLIK